MWDRANDGKPTIPKKDEKRDQANDGKSTIPTLWSQLEKLLFGWMINPEKRKLK